MTDLKKATLKEIVADDFRAAAVFEKYSLDFCCRGGATLDQACLERGLNRETVLADVREALQDTPARADSWKELSMSALIDHIVSVHHAYVRRAIPVLLAHTKKVAEVHGARHSELLEIEARFAGVAADMEMHMMKEERMLFPYIKMLDSASQGGERVSPPPFGTAQNPIHMMEMEHQAAGDEMYAIRALSANYAPPADACTTYRVTYQELSEFERDLHQHVHLENNVLFPAAIALEAKLFAATE